MFRICVSGSIPLAVIAIGLGLMLAPNGVQAAVWNLQPTTGNGGSGWAAEPNWTWSDGNPMSDNGAHWTLAYQAPQNPTLTTTYTPMISGTQYGYYRVWLDTPGNDPPKAYRDHKLKTKSTDEGQGEAAQLSPSSVLLFKPPAAGTYRFQLSAMVDQSNSSAPAGNARVSIYTLSNNRTSATLLQTFDLAEEGVGYQHTTLDDRFSFDQVLSLTDGEEFAVRLQTHSPGTARAGVTTLDFGTVDDFTGQFTVSTVAVPEPAALTVFGSGLLAIIRRRR